MSYITTYTGKHFDPIQPEPGLFDLTDISHALSLLCRGNGHMKHFYSVAQHSIACAEEAKARGYSARVQLGCLLHDASEAYLSDVTRPVKKDLDYYLKVEALLQDRLWAFFIPGRVLSEEERGQIFEIDDAMLSWEFKELMAEELEDGWKQLKTAPDCSFAGMEDVEKRFSVIRSGRWKENEKITGVVSWRRLFNRASAFILCETDGTGKGLRSSGTGI